MEEVKFNTEEVARMLNVHIEAFTKNRKRYEKYLIKDGYVFTKTGRGDNTIYLFTVIPNTWANMDISHKIQDVFGFKPRYPKTMLKYMLWLYRQHKETYFTDKEMADILMLPKSGNIQVNKCRTELIKNVYMYNIKSQKMKLFYLIVDGRKTKVDREYACKVFRDWKDRTDARIKRYMDAQAEKELLVEQGIIKAIKKDVRFEMQNEIGGILLVSKARQMTKLFEEKMKLYCENEGWDTNQAA